MSEVQCVALFLLGFALGMFFYFSISDEPLPGTSSKHHENIVIHEETRKIIPVTCMFELTDEELLHPPSKSWMAENIKHKLANSIWPFVDISESYNPKEFIHYYVAKVAVIQKDNFNPFMEERWKL